jgi:predicted ABC-type transport system involved in lysophospholipase L1 biosynthesis ATPase subunit
VEFRRRGRPSAGCKVLAGLDLRIRRRETIIIGGSGSGRP